MLFIFIVGFLTVLLLIKWLPKWRLSRCLPPCRPGLPFIGSVLDLDQVKLHAQLKEWSKKLGDMFTIWNFGEPIVVVTSYELVDAVHKLAGNRTSRLVYGLVAAGGRSIIQGDSRDEQWKHLRRISYKALKSYGSFLQELEVLIQAEIEDFLQVLEDTKSKAIEPTSVIRTTFCSIISTIIFGERLGRNHVDIQKMSDLTRELMSVTTVSFGLEMDFFPWLRHFNTPTMKAVNNYNHNKNTLLDKYIINYQSENKNFGGILELLMVEMEEGRLTKDEMKADIVEFLSGGVETSQTVLLSVLLLLVTNKSHQRKLQKEIDLTVGRSRLPSLHDQSEMSLLMATLYETFRFVAPVPLSARSTHEPIEINGYHIPENIQFITDIWAVNHDDTYWEEPELWRPERFLDEDEKLLPPDHNHRRRVELVFGAGTRLCIGRHFAKSRLFLIMAAILQKFHIEADPEENPPVFVPSQTQQSVTVIVPKFNIRFVPRN